MNIHFLNWNKEDFLNLKYIYKYVAIDNFLNMLKENYIYMANPQEWKDPYESRLLMQKYVFNENGTPKQYPFKDKLFATCFTSPSSCEAQWNMYSKNEPAVQISFKIETLLEELLKNEGPDLYIGLVKYFNTVNGNNIKDEIRAILSNVIPPTTEDWLRIMLLKRSPYSYEREIRFLAIKENEKELHLKFTDITSAIDKVTLDPDDSNICNQIEEVDELLSVKGIRMSKSILYKRPKNLKPIEIYNK